MAEREAELARLELIRRKGVVISDSDEEDSDAARRSVSAQLRPSHSPAAAKPTPKYLGAVTTPEPSSHGSDTSSGSPASNGDSQEDLPDFILDEEECDEENRMIVEEHRARARAATQGLPFHIKVFIQYQIHRIISPDSNWLERDKDFKISNHYVTSELSGIKDILITSQAWKPAFKKSLDVLPNLEVSYFPAPDDSGEATDETFACGACGRRGKGRATKELIFTGAPYDPVTFKPIVEEVEVSDSDESDVSDISDEAPPRKTWYLGADCAERAHVYHTLQHLSLDTDTHIRNALDSVWVKVKKHQKSALGIIKNTDPARYKKLKNAIRVELETEADRCCAVMDASGQVRSIARKFTSSVENAKKLYVEER